MAIYNIVLETHHEGHHLEMSENLQAVHFIFQEIEKDLDTAVCRYEHRRVGQIKRWTEVSVIKHHSFKSPG